MVVIVIEHLEPVLSEWLLIEYRNAWKFLGEKLLITNVKNNDEKKILEKFVRVTSKRCFELYPRAIVLDPAAEKPLAPEDKNLADAVVVGGILGDHPPRRRTSVLLTRVYRNPIVRNLGKKQLSIDGAAILADLVLNKDLRLDEIEFVDNVTIEREFMGIRHTITLPYRYPVVNGKIILSNDLLRLLEGRIIALEEHLLRNGD